MLIAECCVPSAEGPRRGARQEDPYNALVGRDVMQRDEVARRGVEQGPQLSLLGI